MPLIEGDFAQLLQAVATDASPRSMSRGFRESIQ